MRRRRLERAVHGIRVDEESHCADCRICRTVVGEMLGDRADGADSVVEDAPGGCSVHGDVEVQPNKGQGRVQKRIIGGYEGVQIIASAGDE